MANVRVFLYIFVIFIFFQFIAGKPIFEEIFCGFICDDDSTNPDDDDDFCECGPRPGRIPGNMRVAIAPTTGFNMVMGSNNGTWQMIVSPWNATSTGTPVG